MSLKIVYNKNIHLYKGKKEVSEVSAYIKSIYPEIAQLPTQFTYIDEDSDEITVSCNEDLEALFEFQKTPKLTVSLPKVIPAFKITQAATQIQPPSEEQLKKQKEEEARLQQEKLMKEREQKRKEQEEKRKQQIEKFFQDCKKNKQLSKSMIHFQKKLKEKMPEIQKFLERDFTYEGSSSSESEEEEEKEDQNCPMFFPWARMFGQNQGQWWKGCENWGKWGKKCHQKNRSTKNEEGKTIHRGYACDGCRKFPIVGNRYERTDHPDFDFCESCYNSEIINKFGQQVFEKIEDHVPVSQRFLKKRQQKQQKNENILVHRGYACDGCRQCPIVGPRFERTDHPDFDFCESCYNSETTNKFGCDVFEKVEKYVPPHRFLKKQQFQHQKRKAEERKKQREEKEKLKKEQEQQKQQVDLRVQKLAQEVSQVLGNDEKVYYEICEQYKESQDINFIVDQILNNPEKYNLGC